MATEARMTNTVTIPLEVAVTVRNVFLPANPNKLRSGTMEVKAHAHAFKAAVLRAERQEGYQPISKKPTLVQSAIARLSTPNASHSGTEYMHAHMLTSAESAALLAHINEIHGLLGEYLNEAKAAKGLES